jgi:hypothetical protein
MSGGGSKRHSSAIIAQFDFAKADFLQSLQAHQRALLQMGATIHDLEKAELCSAPQFGSAGDPVNSAGKWLPGDMPLLHWDSAANDFLLDVRELSETVAEEGPKLSTSGWKAPFAPW